MFGGGQDLTLINNDVSNNDLGMRIWDFTDGVDADTVPIIASGNQFANNLNAIDMFNVGGQFFGTAGTGFIISNTAGGLNTVTGSPLTIRGIMENTTIDGLDLSYSGSSASGNGIYYDGSRGNLGANFTIKNVTARNRSTGLNLSPTTGFFGTDLTLINNDVSNSTTGMRLYGFQDGGDSDTQPIIASSNVFTNNQTGLEIYNSPNQYIGTAGTGFIVSNSASGLNTVTGTALNILGLMQNSKIDGLDLSYNGTSRSGSGIKYDGAVNYLGENVTIQNVIARNRDIGINLSPTTGYYGTDLTLINNDVSNSNTGMRLHSFQDGSDADTVPIVASGNIFNNDGTGMYLSSMSGQFIGTSGTGIIFDNNTSGLKSVTGTALVLNTLVSVTVDGLDVSWNGSATHTGQGIYSTDSNNVTVTRVTASNRNEGVRIDGGNLLNINNSTFSNNTTGVTSNNVGTSSLINNNTIQANTNGVSQSGVVQVNGTSNYWGSASAPALNGSNGYTGDVNVGLNLPIAPAGAPSVPAYPPGNVVSFATTANPLEVTTNNDLVSADGYTSLREAIIAANVSGGNITFLAGLNAQTIRLTSPLPPITKQVAIDGGGLITIDGQFNSGDVFFVNGATASNSSIRGLKIKGYASNGFGIRVNGATGVTLQNLDLSDPAGNFVPTGTGIQVENTSSDVTINNVNVSRTTNGIVVSLSDTPKVSNVNASFTGNGVQVTQSASPTITNVNASSTTNGIRVITSANATVRDNTLNNSDLSLYLNGSTGLAVGAIRGNTFSGSSQAVRIDDGQSGLIIGNASLSGTAHVVIEDGTSGMSTVTSRAIYLRGGSANATIDSLQLGFTAGRSGEGIRVDGGGLFLTIRNSNVSGRTNGVTVTAGMNLTLTGNNLSNNGQSVNVSGVKRQAIAPAAAAVTASGNIFTNSANAIAIFGLTAANAGLTIGTTGTENIVINNASSGLQSVTGTAILLSNVDNVAINGIDLSYNGLNGLPRSGTGISGTATPGSTSWTVTNVNASNRTTGISVNGGNDLTLTGNTLVNDGQAISIADVTKLGPASKAVFASGNIFTKSLNALAISNLTGANAGLTIGTTGSENIVINNASSGLQSVTGTAINLSDVDNVTIVNVDVGFTGGSRLGSAIAGSATSNSSFWTIQNVNASNRVSGISISGGKNVTLIGNDLSNNGQSINVSSVTKLAPAVSAVIASGNTFTNSTDAIAISTLNNSDLTIGTTGSENIVINNATAGLQSVVGTAISLNSVGNVTISGVDLGYTGGFRSGAGIKINAGPDSRSTIQNVNASNRFTGIQVTGGKDLTANNNTLTNDGIALFVDSVTKSSLAASVIASGNTFANSGTALQLWNLSSGLTIGTANGSNIKIDNVNSGLQSNTGRVIYLSNISDVNIDGLDVGFNGSVRSGTGIYVDGTNNNNMVVNLVTATNRSTGLRLGDAGQDLTVTNNNLSNNGLALYINNFSDGPDAGKTDNTVPVIATGNTFTGSTSGIELYNMTNQVVATTGTGIIVANTDGLKDSTATALRLSDMNGLTVSGLDLSYLGAGRSGTGIFAGGTNHNMTITGVTATNRSTGFRLGDAGQDLTLTNNNLSNNGLALFLNAFSDGSDINTVPVIATGNTFTGSSSGIELYNMTNQVVATAGTGIIVANTDGLKDSTATALRLSDMNGLTVSGLDLSYLGAGRSGTGIFAGGTNHNMTITGVTATNRSTGFRLGDAGQDLTLTNNNLSNNGLALFLNAFSDGSDINTVPVIATGNTFTGSSSGIELYNMTNQVVATAGTGIIVANTDGLKDSTATALRLSNMNGLTVSSLDLSYLGAGRSGTGIYADGTNHNLTITGVNATRRNRGFRIGDAGQDLILTNNDLSNTNYGLFIRGYYDGDDADTVPVVASGNKFFGVITEALVVHNMSGLYIGTTGTGFIINNATDGLNSTPGVALRIHNIPYSTIDGIDLSYPGTKRSGYGIRAIEDFSDSDYLGGFIRIIGRNVTIQNVIATNRDYGINLVGGGVAGGGDDLKLLNNNLSNNGTSLGLRALTDGDDADNAPFSGTGNKFTGSTNGIFLEGMRNDSLVFGNSIAPGVNFVIDGNSGLTSVSGDALYLFNVNNVTIDGVDLSYRGFRRSGTGIRANDSFVNNLTLKNVTITNRITGLTYNPNTNSAEYLLKIQDSNFLNNDTAIIAAQYNAGGYIRNSRIEGNDTGLVYSTDSSNPTYSIVLDAKGNYWGPGGGGAAGVNNNNGFTSNPADKVDSSGYVATIPAVLNRDYGDAPIAFAFSTSLAGFGARHIATGPMLGTIRDTEPDVTGSTLSNADNITATNDEDGVTVGILTPGANATATVFVTSSGAAKLDAWIDFNRDGDWDDTGEKIANSVSVVNGPNTLTFAVPGSASISLNYARFRISTAGGLDTFGEAVDGEVEDYVVGNIYVDDNWTNNANFPVGTVITDSDPIMAGDQWGIMGLNAFATVNGGLAAAAAGTQNQVIVNSGNYSTENANVTKAGLVVIFQEGASTLGSLDDTVSTAIVNLAGITLTTGGTNLATRFDSSIVGNGNLIKAGSGKMTLAGNNTFTGNTTINGGTLALASSSNNNIASSPIITVGSGTILEVAELSGTELQLASGQTLSGTGTVTGGAVKALSSSTIDPAGSSTGILNTQSVVFASGSTFNVQVNGTTLAGTDYDQLNVTGAVNLGNATLNAAGIVTSEGVPIVLINNDGNDTVIGTFNGLAEKANVTINGKRFVVTYQGGSNNNDVVLLSPTPINTIPGNQTVDEDVSLAFVAGVNGISVLDYDDNLSTTKLTVINGKLTIGSLAGGASISAGANNSSTLTLSGTQTQINAALATLSYKGNQDYNGSDSLVVVSTDAQNNVDTDTISISITPVNDAPVAVNDGTALAPFGVVPKGGSLSTGTGVLNNDSDVDVGDVLTAELFTNVLHGSLTLNANGSFNYRPTSNYSGPDSFTYRAKDIAGLYSNVATVFLNVVNDAPTDILLSNNIVSENSNTAVDLAIGNLTSVDANVGDTAGFTLLAGLDEALFLISGSTLKLKAGVSVDFETRPSYRVNVRVTDGSGATFDKELTIFVRDLAEVASIQLNDGAVQRSVLTKLVVTFDTAVSIDSPGAFVVRNRNTNTFAAIRIATATNSSGKTAATITFASGANVNNRASANSLVDGNYELQIYGSLITSIATGLKVDAAKTGNSSGSNDVFGDQAIDRFFRLFGDIDGDRDVDALDNAQFKPTLNSTLVAKPTIYKAEFDFDGDGDIDALDNLRFRQNLNKTMPAI